MSPVRGDNESSEGPSVMVFDWEEAKYVWTRHKGKIVGAAAGFLIGLLIIRYGFWRTLLMVSLAAGGLWLGSLLDREGWENLYDRVTRRYR